MGLMTSEGEYHEARNDSHWLDQKNPSFTRLDWLENTNWDTLAVCISVAEEAIRKSTGRVNAPIECWDVLTKPDIMQTGYTPSGTSPTRWNDMLRRVLSSKLKSTNKTILQWDSRRVEVKPKTCKRRKLYMHTCFHGVWKNRKAYILHTVRKLMSNGILLNPTKYQSNLWRCYRRWKAS